jgi:hypothetical protein
MLQGPVEKRSPGWGHGPSRSRLLPLSLQLTHHSGTWKLELELDEDRHIADSTDGQLLRADNQI